MAESNVKITFEIDGLEQSVTSIDDAKNALSQLEDQAKKAEKSIEDTGKQIEKTGKEAEKAGEAGEGAIAVLDEATGGLASRFKNVIGGIGKMGTALKTSFKAGVQGASSLKKALIATGVGAIVVAVGLLVSYWDDIKGLVSGVSAEQKKLLAETQATATAAEEQLAATEASENSLKLAGKSEEEIRDLKIQQTDEIITATEAVLEQQRLQAKAQEEAAIRNRNIAQNVLRFLLAPVTLILSTVDAMTAAISKIPGIDISTNLEESFSGGIAEMLFDPEEVAAEGQATVEETEKQLAALRNKRDGYILADQKADQDARDKAKAEREKVAAEEAALLEKLAAEKEAARKKQEAADAAALQKQIDNRNTIDALLQQADLDSIQSTYDRAQAELEIQRQKDLETLRMAGATEAEIFRIQQQYDAKSKKLEEENEKFKEDLREADVQNALSAGSAVLGSIVDLVGEGSAVGKAAALAQVAIDTYGSATAAYKSVVGIPVVGPVLAPIAAGVAVASGLASAKKIMSTKIPGDKSVAAPSITAPPTGPTVDPNAAIESAAQGQESGGNITLGNQQGSTGGTIVKAYVVSSDMTSQQEADKKINDLARL